VLERCHPQLRAALGDQGLQQMWSGLELKLGEYQEIERTESVRKGDQVGVLLHCRFSGGRLVVRLVLDSESRFGGIWFDKIEVDPPAADDEDPAKPYREQSITVGQDGKYPLPGTITLPKQVKPLAGVVLVHGSGAHNQDETVAANKPFRDLAHGLATRGIAVLRYQKRTHRYPTAVTPEQVTLDWETTDDAVAALELLARRAAPETGSNPPATSCSRSRS
jgi:hypothetical protein